MRIPNLAALVLLAPALPAGAQSSETPAPVEVRLTLGCPVSPCRFQLGEVIQLNLVITATEAGYGVQAMEGSRERAVDSFTATPGDGVSDPLDGRTVAMNGSGILGVPHLVPGQPFSVQVELNQWIRFGRPGRFQVTARSSRPFRQTTFGGIHLVSDPIEIEIVPADAQWQKEQLARIVAELPEPGAAYSPRAAAAVRALAYLRSDDALREIRKHVPEGPIAYLSNDFIQRNMYYVLDWEMARLELFRRPALTGR